MTPTFTCRVYGKPVPQGSKRSFIIPAKAGRKARAIVTESNSKQGAWRDTMSFAFVNQRLTDWLAHMDAELGHRAIMPEGVPPPTFVKTAVNVAAIFIMPRPASAKKGAQPISAPDLDKLQRCLGDSLQEACVMSNDSTIVSWDGSIKRYAVDGEAVGLHVTVTARPYEEATRIP